MLAKLPYQGDHVVITPSTKRSTRLEENAAAAELRLTADDLRGLDRAAPVGATADPRNGNPAMMEVVRR